MTILKAGELGRPANAMWRCIQALVQRNVAPGGEAAFLRSLEGDATTPMLLRAATAGARLDTASWAGLLASQAVIDWLASLGPMSAASQLIAMSLGVPLAGNQSVTAPGLNPKVINGGFVGEGDPIAAAAFTISGPTLSPKKLAFFCTITRELAKRSRAQALVETAMRESASVTLDSVLFNAAGASAAAPAGLLNGAVPITPSGGGMLADLTDLAAAVAPIAGGNIVFIASPTNAVRANIGTPRELPYPVLPSSALDDETVIAAAPNALAFTSDPVPEIVVSTEATMHLDDEPDQISTTGSPPVLAHPTVSMFQTDQLAIRLILDVSWAKRHSSAVAVATGVDWEGGGS
jgi:hypothetical protein